jgi:hypothetical protein
MIRNKFNIRWNGLAGTTLQKFIRQLLNYPTFFPNYLRQVSDCGASVRIPGTKSQIYGQ